MTRVVLCAPQPVYLIVEQIHRKPGLPSLPKLKGVIGPSLYQVYRRVMQVCDEQNVFFEGRRIPSMPSTWQYIQEFLMPGQQITTRLTGKKQFVLVYAGFINILTPLPKIGDLFPESWTRQYDLGTPPSPFTYGNDPIPNMLLHNNSRAGFVMFGNNPPPIAVGVYHKIRQQLELPTVNERKKVIQSLLQPNPSRP